MKKLLTILVLALALCLICGLASAEVKFNNGYNLDYGAGLNEYTSYAVTVNAAATINVAGENYPVVGVSWNLDDTPAATLNLNWSSAICQKPVQIVVHYTNLTTRQKVENVILFYHRYPALTNANAATLIKAATCTEPGEGMFKCVRVLGTDTCAHLEKLTIPAMGHNPIEIVDEPATCTVNGKAHKECSRCHIVLEPQYAKIGGHQWVTLWHDPECAYGVPEATWGATGYWTTKCATCGKYASLAGNPVYETVANATPNNQLVLSDVMNATNMKPFATLAAYNAELALYGFEEISGHAWDWDIWTYVAPTCVEAGYKVRWCSRCHEDERIALTAAELALPEYKDWDKVLGPDWVVVLRDDALVCNFAWPAAGTCPEAYIVCSICGGTEKGHKIVNSAATVADKMGVTYTAAYTAPTAAELKQANMKAKWTVTPTPNNYTAPLYAAAKNLPVANLAADMTHVYKQEAQYAVMFNATTVMKSVPTCEAPGLVYYRCIYAPAADAAVGTVVHTADGIGVNTAAAAHYIEAVQYDNKLDHDWKAWVEEYPATEDHTGWWHRDCQRRVTTQTGVVWTCPAHQDEHLMFKPCEKHVAKKVVDVPAKCGVEGAQHWECAECGAPLATPEGESKVIPALDHVWNAKSAWTIKEAATCTKDGVAIKECTLCHIYEDVVLKAEGHKVELVKGEAATHTKEGKKDAYKCSVCEKLFEDKEATKEVKEADLVIAKTPEHDWDKATVEIVKEATCKEAGKKLLTCECGETKTVAIPVKAEHAALVEVAGKDATCKDDGLEACWKCPVCEKLFADKEGKTAITEQKVIPAKPDAHVKGELEAEVKPTCEKAGKKVYTCTVCGKTVNEVVPALGHDWGEWEVTTPATLEKDGEATRVCKNDPTHKETKPVKYEATDPAKYEVKVDYSKPKATGTVELDPHTKPLTKAYARVTFFLANGDCMIQIVEVKDGKFTAGAEGNFTHVSVIIVDDAEAYGAEEAIEHAHGNGGIEL